MKVKTKKARTFTYALLFISATALFGFFSYVIAANYVDSPKEKALIRENENLKLNFNYLNKRVDLAEQVLENISDRDDNIYRVHFEANPVSEAQRKAGFGGVNRYKKLEGLENSEIIIASTQKIDLLTKEIEVQSRSLDEIEALAKEKIKLLEAIPAIQPVQNKITNSSAQVSANRKLKNNKRKRKSDRRSSVRDGVVVTLSYENNRRRGFDRRKV